MKPSERIKQLGTTVRIMDIYGFSQDVFSSEVAFNSLLRFLDEEWEKRESLIKEGK